MLTRAFAKPTPTNTQLVAVRYLQGHNRRFAYLDPVNNVPNAEQTYFDVGTTYGGLKVRPILPPDEMPMLSRMARLVDPAKIIKLSQLYATGAHFGARAEDYNSGMRPYILGERGDYHILDMYYTLAAVRTLGRIFQYITLNGGQILFVCFKEKYKQVTRYYARNSFQPIIYDKWRPGFFTNIDEVLYNTRNSKKVKLERGVPQNSAKHRQTLRRREAVDGFANLKGYPEMIFFTNMHKSQKLMKEAHAMRIPCAGIVDSDSDPTGLTYPIPLNDDNFNAIGLVLKTLSTCARDGEDYKFRLNSRYATFLETDPDKHWEWESTTYIHPKDIHEYE